MNPEIRNLDTANLSDFQPSAKAVRQIQSVAILGGAILLAGVILAPDRFWPNFLLGSYLLVGIGLSAVFFMALQYVIGASWAVALRRVPEAMSAVLPVAALGLAAVFLFQPSIYSWVGGSEGAESLTGFKAAWLTLPFFWVRSAVYLMLWIALAYAIVHTSRRQDRDGDFSHTRRNVRFSALFLVVFAVTFSLASFDWIMSLEPDWYSTIFGVYNFAGMFSGGLAALILLVIWLRRAGPLRDFVNEEHFHDLGKLLFAFSIFWMYIWFCQYMLIWYSNIPEETIYFVHRLHKFWEPVFLLNIFLNWVIPFLVLLPRSAKRNPAVLGKVAIVMLAGRWWDVYLMIFPPLVGPAPVFGIWEVGAILGAVGLFLIVFLRAVRQAPLVPVNDPYLSESLQYHN